MYMYMYMYKYIHTIINIYNKYIYDSFIIISFSGSPSSKEPACKGRRQKRRRFNPWVGKIPWRRAWQPTPVLLPGESHGQRSLAGYSARGHEKLDTTNGTSVFPLQCSCLGNPRDREAWWAAVSGVAQSRKRLKQLGSNGTSHACIE